MNYDGLDLSILGPAFVAGILVLVTHVPLGQEVIRRGIIFIDLAVAQFAGLGVIFAGSMGWEAHGLEVQIVAFLSALFGAGLLDLMERRLGNYQEAVIGVSFVLAATGSILLLANNSQGGEHLKELLVGQILWVEWQQLIVPLLIATGVVLLWATRPKAVQGHGFYVFFALAITASVQLVGIYLVFASLIIPALVTVKYKDRGVALCTAFILGAVSYAVGLTCSALFDLPGGPMIVWVMALFAIATGWISGRVMGSE
jgi:zinc/manganese transport system permease protein